MLTNLLIHRVEVYARSGKKDRFGQPVDINPRSHIAGETVVATYPCRAYMKSGGLTMEERNIDLFERIHMMFTGLEAEIFEDDAVRVFDRDGRVLINLCKVKDSETKFNAGNPHHKEFTLWEQSGPSPARES